MNAPLMLGGITVPIESGAPECTYEPAGGATDVTLTSGTVVRMRRWSKELITITGNGWFATGLDALNWDNQHILRCNKPKRMAAGLTATLPSDPRPDVPVQAVALVDGQAIPTPVSMAGRNATVTAVTGATSYIITWYPQYLVLCTPPPEQHTSAGVDWTLICREV